MFVAAFAHACLYGYKVMYPTEALPETVQRMRLGIEMLCKKSELLRIRAPSRDFLQDPEYSGSGHESGTAGPSHRDQQTLRL